MPTKVFYIMSTKVVSILVLIYSFYIMPTNTASTNTAFVTMTISIWCSPGPSRSELERIKQFMSQTESTPPPLQQQSSPFGGMRMPGRRKRGPDPDSLGLSPGGVTGETIKASMLGDLAVIDIANSPMEVTNPSAEVVRKWEEKFTMRRYCTVLSIIKKKGGGHAMQLVQHQNSN